MAGLLYGYRGGLGKLTEQFQRTGVSHIVAISGYNVAIIVQLLMIVSSHLWIPRRKVFWSVLIFLCLFVIFTGMTGSVVRAAIMGVLFLFAQHVGRLSSVTNSLVFAVVVMTLQNPFLLAWDTGFQLSFLAFAGLAYVGPVIHVACKKIPPLGGLKDSFVATVSATLATLPLIMFDFGTISIVGLLVNILVLWIIPWVMIGGFLSVLIALGSMTLGYVIAWIPWIGMRYIVLIVQWFGKLEWASVSVSVPLWFVLCMYMCMIVWLDRWYRAKAKVEIQDGYFSQHVLPMSKS